MTIGERILETRKCRGISQVQLANDIGVSRQTIYKYEKDIVTNIPLPKIAAIAANLGVAPSYIAGWGEWKQVKP